MGCKAQLCRNCCAKLRRYGKAESGQMSEVQEGRGLVCRTLWPILFQTLQAGRLRKMVWRGERDFRAVAGRTSGGVRGASTRRRPRSTRRKAVAFGGLTSKVCASLLLIDEQEHFSACGPLPLDWASQHRSSPNAKYE